MEVAAIAGMTRVAKWLGLIEFATVRLCEALGTPRKLCRNTSQFPTVQAVPDRVVPRAHILRRVIRTCRRLDSAKCIMILPRVQRLGVVPELPLWMARDAKHSMSSSYSA